MGDVGEGLAAGVVDDGDGQAVVEDDGNADVDAAVAQDAGAVPGVVQLRVGP